ncbi:Pol I core factor CF [Ascosphaera atra]|nr:Pol I core factor CF [Ascosphaera atra]
MSILPTGDRIHRAIADLILLYHRSFNMKIPGLNVPLMQFSYIRELCLPSQSLPVFPSVSSHANTIAVEIYPAMNGLQSLLNYSLAYPHVVNGKKFRRIHLPEVQLMSLLVVAVKLLYPFDSDDATGFGELKTYASSELDPSAQRMGWRTWMDVQREAEEEDGKTNGGMGPEKALYLQETDVFGLSGEQMDEYMDWYEKMFVYSKGEYSSHVRRAVARLLLIWLMQDT